MYYELPNGSLRHYISNYQNNNNIGFNILNMIESVS